MKEALSSSENRFLKEPHGVTSQETSFFMNKNPHFLALKMAREQ
jgi:hypothetical protein